MGKKTPTTEYRITDRDIYKIESNNKINRRLHETNDENKFNVKHRQSHAHLLSGSFKNKNSNEIIITTRWRRKKE